MGVHGLWDLLAPVGRRVSVETLSCKKLAIDASIWMVQFLKAMRDEKGEMIRNAHLLGFFRRICKLLYLRTKPVFVFDGATPALKRRTVIARRRQRENAQAKIRKTAEKLLLNHLKAMRLKDLAEDLENQRRKQKIDAKGKQISVDPTNVVDSNAESTYTESYDQEKLDEMLAASIAAEEGRHLNNNESTSTAVVPDQEQDDSDENEEIIKSAVDGNVDPDVLAVLPTYMQLDLLMRERSSVQNRKNKEGRKDVRHQDEDHKGNVKAKVVLSDEMDILARDHLEKKSCNHEMLDEMLAASIMAEEDESLTQIASRCADKIPAEVEGDDEDEEMLLPALCGKVDPAVLAALPPSMQLDLLVQMRERLMAENRQRYQKVKKAPEKFSNLQIEAYLKTVAFRREIDQVQKAAAGKDVGGVQTSRIASEANKEFIFSSSFTGDKQLLTSGKVQRNGNNSSDSMERVASASKTGTATAFVRDGSNEVFDEDVETYVDERGRTRVSRVRAMGMHMTRDLQRNLDLIKEIERERRHTTSAQSELRRDKISSPKSIPSIKQNAESSNDNHANPVKLNERTEPILTNESSIQISFEVGGDNKCTESDDDIFTSLVAGQPVNISSVGGGTLTRQSSDSASDGDWQEGSIEGRDNDSSKNETLKTNPPPKDTSISDDSEVEWEEGNNDVHESSIFPSESRKPASRGYVEEEADLQEAIRRSLEDFGGEKFSHMPPSHEKLTSTSENACKSISSLDGEGNTDKVNLVEKDTTQKNKPFNETLAIGMLDGAGHNDILHAFSSSQRQLKLSEVHDTDNLDIPTDKSGENDLCSNAGQPNYNMNIGGNLGVENIPADSATPLEAREIDMIVKGSLDTFVEDVGISTSSSSVASHILKSASHDMHISIPVGDEGNQIETKTLLFANEEKKSEPPSHSVVLTNPMEPFKDSTTGTDVEPILAGEKNPVRYNGKEHCVDKQANDENLQADFSEANLQDEILILGQERMDLGKEQKKLESNAESVSSEMFAECQELLQMFGLPYIIAPMEAEAQCAYMELANLVDGVVTDDSDVFLFGARSVYKNIFDDRKYVETYFMKDIEKELGLTREKLIRMALLLGSDYTEGISGIGIVNAIEVVNAFPEEDGLQKFREWIESPDPNILGKFDAHTGFSAKKKGSEVGDHGSNYTLQDHDQECPADHSQHIKQIFMNNHARTRFPLQRNVSKNWHVPSSFPSEPVISAYFLPQVDKSTDPFTWGKPDINVLRRLCWEKFGWGIQKSDELLLPVLKEYNKHETQLRLEAFYTFNERFAKIRSNRIKKAVKGITGKQSSDLVDDAVKESPRNGKKRTVRAGESGNKNREAPPKRAKGSVRSFKTNSLEKITRNQSSKRTAGEPVSTELENTGQLQQGRVQGRRNNKKGSHGDGKGRGRGGLSRRRKGRGRGRGFEHSGSSSVDVSSGDDNLEISVDKAEGPQELRRSMRTRKPASYILNDSEIDEVGNLLDHDGEKSDQEPEWGLTGNRGVSEGAGISLNRREDQNVENPLCKDFSMDYLETGGGFVNEDDEGGESKNYYHYEQGLSKDNINMGGGFCLDENEMATGQDVACDAGQAPDSSNFSHPMDEAGFGEDPQSDLNVETLNGIRGGEKTNALDSKLVLNCGNTTESGDNSKLILSMPESTESNAVRSSLSAMPFLKRKRRKN